MPDIKNYLRDSRKQEVDSTLENTIAELAAEGLIVEFGHIGQRTTYALVYNEDHSVEIVGYTFIKDMKYYRENVGQLKALQQAIARKNTAPESK